MTAPNYDWVCQRCDHINMSGTDQCEKCGFNAFFKVKQLNANESKNEVELTLPRILGVVFVGICGALYFKYSNALPDWMQMWLDPRLLIFSVFLILVLIFVVFATIYKFIVTALNKFGHKSDG